VLSRLTIFIFSFLAIVCTTPVEKQPPKEIIYLPPTIKDSTDINDDNILRAVYSEYKFPEGFFQEDFKGGSPYYENTISIRVLNDHWFELSTDDRDQAFAWSESSSVHSSYYRTLDSERETEKFFEFRRVWLAHPTDILLSRVHKASYIDRLMFDRINPGDTLAIFRAAIIDTITVKELVEYLWFYDNYNIGGSKALCSQVVDLGKSLQYRLFHTMVSYGDWGLCDHISVFRTAFTISKQNGVLTRTTETIKTLNGKCN